MINIQELELEFNSFYGDKESEHTLLARMFPLIAEVRRLRDKLDLIRNTVLYDIEENFTEKQAHDPVIIDIMKKIYRVIE